MPDLAPTDLDIQNQLMSRAGFLAALNKYGIALEYAIGMYRTVLARRPKTVLEIGIASGASTITILSALSALGGDRILISIDPSQSTSYGNVSLNNVKANGFSSLHRLIEDPDYLALPDLIRQHLTPDMAYVDGWHTFDYVLLDFFFIDKLLPVGGVIGFNDAGWRSIRKVLRFVLTHRKYTELDIGLKPSYQGRNMAATIGRRVLNVVNNDRWFEKKASWEPEPSYYASF